MFDYIKGILFVIAFIWFLSALGKRLHKSEAFCENLIYGFVIYTSIQFVGGFIVQQLRLPWIVFQGYMIILLIGLLILIFYKNTIKINKQAVIRHFKRYGLIYLIAVVFVVLSCLNIQYQWNGNHVDDGYYLLKIKMAPYLDNFVDYNYAVGVEAYSPLTRNVNTFEIEAAFYRQMLGMDAAIFSKVFLAFFNYTLLLNVIYWFYSLIAAQTNKVKFTILILVPILFFGIYYEIVVNYQILFLHDGWQFNTAMWYGSSLVRTISFFLLIIPVLTLEKPTLKTGVFFCMTSMALLSKASQIFPIIVLFAIIYVIQVLRKLEKRRTIINLGILIFFVVLAILPVNEVIEVRTSIIQNLLQSNMTTIVLRITIFLIFISYLFEIPFLRKWNNWLLALSVLIFVPRINTLFAYACMYDFVAGRTVTLLMFTLIVTAVFNGYYILTHIISSKKQVALLYGIVGLVIISIPIISIQKNIGMANTVQLLKNNPRMNPQSTLELSKKLDNLSNKINSKITVLMPMWLSIDGTPHSAASFLSYYSQNVISLGTAVRYHDFLPTSILNDYDQATQDIVEQYIAGAKYDDVALENLLTKYSVNCIILYNPEIVERVIDKYGYQEYEKIPLSDGDQYYHILYKDVS